tara:strand:- start:160 stop:705 length:546 start_codon:yes stop_codon:yes gene_type:complete
MSAPGDKAKLVDMWDNSLAVETGLTSIYKIEILFSRSQRHGVKCGAICVFRNNTVDLAVNPLLVDGEKLREMEKEMSRQTDMMHMDPIHFRADKGQWIDWAMDKALELYDRFGGASIAIKAPRLKITERRTNSEVAAGRSDMTTLFRTLRDIDRLLSRDYKWDPWSQTVRRGEINAKKGGR